MIKNSTKFILHHSAKDVLYESKNFIDRNTDSMSPSLNQFLLDKCSASIKKIYSMKANPNEQEEEPEDPKNKKRVSAAPKTIWGKFSIQINELMNELAEPLIPNDFNPDKAILDAISAAANKKGNQPQCEKCELHFIRCIKPNDAKIKDFYIHAMTLQQITYMGVLESIKVKQENFPYRKSYEEFYKQYELLSPAYSEGRYAMMTAP